MTLFCCAVCRTCLALSALYFKTNVDFSMYKITFRKVNKCQSKERNQQKKTIMINEGKIEKGNERRTSKIDAVLDLVSFDAFVVLLVVVNIKKEPGGSKSSRYVFYLQRNSTENNNQTN